MKTITKWIIQKNTDLRYKKRWNKTNKWKKLIWKNIQCVECWHNSFIFSKYHALQVSQSSIAFRTCNHLSKPSKMRQIPHRPSLLNPFITSAVHQSNKSLKWSSFLFFVKAVNHTNDHFPPIYPFLYIHHPHCACA